MKKNSIFTNTLIISILAFIVLTLFLPETVSAKSLRVRKNGTGDFTTIQAAVNNANSGDTIYIGPGTYVEPVTIVGKTLSLIGSNRSKCIIKYSTADYFNVPLYIQAGEVKNLTIIGHDGQAGYAIHIDNDYQFNRSISFSNCRIVSRNAQQCLGIGTYGNNSISFNNCTFESNTRVMFYHNTVRPELAGPSAINFNSCKFKGSGIEFINGINFESSDPVTVTQTNCVNTFVVIPPPAEPEPVDPAPVQPTPAQPAPAQPDPSLPAITSVVAN